MSATRVELGVQDVLAADVEDEAPAGAAVFELGDAAERVEPDLPPGNGGLDLGLDDLGDQRERVIMESRDPLFLQVPSSEEKRIAQPDVVDPVRPGRRT